jgi:hypothetical protein
LPLLNCLVPSITLIQEARELIEKSEKPKDRYYDFTSAFNYFSKECEGNLESPKPTNWLGISPLKKRKKPIRICISKKGSVGKLKLSEFQTIAKPTVSSINKRLRLIK